MREELLVTLRHNPHVDPVLSIWGWEISIYLFLGGLTAGLMFFAGLLTLLRKDRTAPFATTRLALIAPLVLSVGMTTLFLDLEYKLHVFRFYLTLRPSSPMSWGSWILILVYPVIIVQALSTLRRGWPRLAGWLERLPLGRWLLDLCERLRRPAAAAALPVGVALAIYTGILLSAFAARPFWNTGLLGVLFLVSGLSTGAALAALLAREPAERRWFVRTDLGLILVEMLIVGLLVINLATGARPQLEAARHILGGDYTLAFWILFFTVGLAVPVLIEAFEPLGLGRVAMLAPVLVLVGGYVLRDVTVRLGQETTWIDYTSEYDAALLQRVETRSAGP